MGKPHSKLTILRTLRKDFKEQKSEELDDIIRKGFIVMTNTTIGLTLVSPIRPRFWYNAGMPYSKLAIMRTQKSLECKRKALRIKFQ